MQVTYVNLNSLSLNTESGSFVRLNIDSLNRIGPDSFDTLIENDKVNISFMVRSPVTNIMNIITRNLPTNKRILTGPPGCGKSSSIYQIVQYCKLNGWIVVYLPKCEVLMFENPDEGEKIFEETLMKLIQFNQDIFDIAS